MFCHYCVINIQSAYLARKFSKKKNEVKKTDPNSTAKNMLFCFLHFNLLTVPMPLYFMLYIYIYIDACVFPYLCLTCLFIACFICQATLSLIYQYFHKFSPNYSSIKKQKKNALYKMNMKHITLILTKECLKLQI